MGLLKKANDNKLSLAVLKSQSDADNIFYKKKNRIEHFLLEISKIKQGIEYSRLLFESFSNFFEIQKGSLLLLETESNTFLPVSYINMDITTTRHLRIPSIVLDKQFLFFNEIITIPDQKIKILKQFFSIREYSAMTSLILVPFYYRGILNSALLIIDPSAEIVETAREISLKSEKFVKKLINSRKPFNNTVNLNKRKPDKNPELILQEYIDKNIQKNITFLIIKINLTLLKETLVQLLPNSDPYDISKDIIKSITQLINPTGEFISISSDIYILFYKIKTGKNPDLILHQINLAITSFFNLSQTLPKIETELKSIPDYQCEKAETILDGII